MLLHNVQGLLLVDARKEEGQGRKRRARRESVERRGRKGQMVRQKETNE
jgi:hypothetical protein